MKKIPATVPSFNQEDINYVTENFRDILLGKSFLSQYKYSEQFEDEFSKYIGSEYSVTCNSGTSALEIIFRSLDVSGKEVILPSNTFIATANAIINSGGIPVFADCDETMSLDYEDALSKITKDTVAICHVHIGGIVSDSAIKISEYCKKNDLYFVEDAAQAHGTINKNRFAGTLGDAAGFSFYSTKVMTTGEGGMITTSNKNLVKKMKSIREFGKEKKGNYTNYHTSMGYNWRMPEVASLMGIRQLKSIEAFINKRTSIAEIYNSNLIESPKIKILKPPATSRFNYFKYTVILENLNRDTFHSNMNKKGIELSGYVYELPLHKQPVFSEYKDLELRNSEYLCAQHICLPIYPNLSEKDALYIANTFNEIISTS